MTEFRDQEMDGAVFERVSLRGARFRDVYLNEASIRDVDLTGADIRAVAFHRIRMRGVELLDVDISGEVENVVVNGVDIGPLVEAELDRRDPDRVKMRPTTVDGFREGFALVERLWDGTVAWAGTLPEELLHASVDGEWSFVQTLRHLSFATGCWVDRMILGRPDPYRPTDLPWDEAPPGDWFHWERDVPYDLDEVLAVRRERQAAVRELLAGLTDARLDEVVSAEGDGWPEAGMEEPVGQCLRVLLNEEWHHRLFAERDLDRLQQREN
jgi:uncharacterized damage-inducible protein DinB